MDTGEYNYITLNNLKSNLPKCLVELSTSVNQGQLEFLLMILLLIYSDTQTLLCKLIIDRMHINDSTHILMYPNAK